MLQSHHGTRRCATAILLPPECPGSFADVAGCAAGTVLRRQETGLVGGQQKQEAVGMPLRALMKDIKLQAWPLSHDGQVIPRCMPGAGCVLHWSTTYVALVGSSTGTLYSMTVYIVSIAVVPLPLYEAYKAG